MIKLQNTQQIIRVGAKTRKKSIISTSNLTNRNYTEALRGKRSDTKELNINLKTITVSFLRTAVKQNELSQPQKILFLNYIKMPANFKSLQYMFREVKGEAGKQENQVQFIQAREKLRKMCLSFYRSTAFIKHFIISRRMKIKNKLVILKFLSKIQEKAGKDEQNMGWKNTGVKAYQI